MLEDSPKGSLMRREGSLRKAVLRRQTRPARICGRGLERARSLHFVRPHSKTVEQEFYIGDWHINSKRHRIERNGDVIYVEPKVMDVLLFLALHPGVVVSRKDIMETVWDDVVVGDEVLTRAVSELRKAFLDDHRAPTVIETVPSVGYRLLAPVRRDQERSIAGASESRLPAGSVRRTESDAGRRWIFTGGVACLLLLAIVAGFFHRPRMQPRPFESVPLTSYPGLELDPAFSPDEAQIAFTRREIPDGFWHIYVRVLGTESVLQLTDEPASDLHPAWSPDGRYLAFIRSADDECGLYRIPALGGSEKRLTTCAGRTVVDLTWSPDGSELAYSASDGRGEPFSIYSFSLEERVTSRLTQPAVASGGDYYLTFTDDGRRIAFIRESAPGLRDIYSLSLREHSLERLTSDNRSDNGLALSPDGRKVLFSTYHGSNFNIWQAASSGGPSHWLAAGPGSASNLEIARKSGNLAYVHWQYDTNVWSAPARPDTASPRPFIVSTQEDARAEFSPDGRRVAFVSSRSGLPEIWLSEVDGSDPTQLTSLGGYNASPPRWSPDGRRLVFDHLDSRRGTVDLYVVDVEGGPPKRLTTDAATDMAPSWSGDGVWVYFGSNRTGSWQIWKTPADGGEAVRVTRHGGLAAQESPDGTLYYVRRDTTGLWRFSNGHTGDIVIPLPLNSVEDWADWVVRDDGCYFVERPGPGRSGVAYFDFATATTVPLLETTKVVRRNSGLSVSPDGQWILYTQEDHVESDLMVVNGFSSSL